MFRTFIRPVPHMLIVFLLLFPAVISLTFAQEDDYPPTETPIDTDGLEAIYNPYILPHPLDYFKPLARLGEGYYSSEAWSPDSKTLAISSSMGLWLYDASDLNAPPRQLNDEPAWFGEIQFSPDGRWLAVETGTIELWDVATGTLFRKFYTEGSPDYFAFSHDSQRLAISNHFSYDYTLETRIWDIMQPGAGLLLDNSWIDRNLRFTPDGRYLTALHGIHSPTPIVYDALSGIQHSTLHDSTVANEVQNGYTAADTLLVSTSDGTPAVLVASHMDTLALWDLHLETRLAVRPWETNEQTLLGVIDDGATFLTYRDGVVAFYDSDTLTLNHSVTLESAEGQPIPIISPDGRRAFAADYSGYMRLWDLKSGELVDERFGLPSIDHRFVFSPNGYEMLIGTRIWDVRTQRPVRELQGHPEVFRYAAYSSDGTMIVTTSDDATARLWDAETGILLKTITEHESPLIVADFFLRGATLVTVSEDGMIGFWEPLTGNPDKIVGVDVKDADDDPKIEMRHIIWLDFEDESHEAIRFATDNINYIMLADNQGGVYSWSTEYGFDGILRAAYQDNLNRPMYALAKNEEGFIFGGENSVLRVLSFRGDLGTLTTHPSWIKSIATTQFHYGNIVVSSSCSYTGYSEESDMAYCFGMDLRLWETNEDERHRPPVELDPPHTATIYQVGFNPAGTLMATASEDGTIVLWGVDRDDE